MGARLQRLPVGGRHIPVDDGAIGLGDLAVRDARRLHGIVDINAANQQQRTQNHSDKRLHGSPSVAADNAVPGGWFHLYGPSSRCRIPAFTPRGEVGLGSSIWRWVPLAPAADSAWLVCRATCTGNIQSSR